MNPLAKLPRKDFLQILRFVKPSYVYSNHNIKFIACFLYFIEKNCLSLFFFPLIFFNEVHCIYLLFKDKIYEILVSCLYIRILCLFFTLEKKKNYSWDSNSPNLKILIPSLYLETPPSQAIWYLGVGGHGCFMLRNVLLISLHNIKCFIIS